MRHIPEDELHAYLDQALSRSQDVEIERHLARCRRCQAERDAIAALRDRTTALLARVGPPPILSPAFEVLATRAALGRRRVMRTRLVAAGLAATVIAALAGRWTWSRGSPPGITLAVGTTQPVPERRAEEDLPVTARARHPVTPAGQESAPRLRRVEAPTFPARTPTIRLAATVEAAPTGTAEPSADPAGTSLLIEQDTELIHRPVGTEPALRGLWRTIVPDDDRRPEDIPMVPGLPVAQMRAQPGQIAEEEVTAVDQFLDSGEIVRTLAGPADRVARIVEGDLRTPAPAGSRMTVTLQQGERMVAVTGPSPALGTLLSRVSLRRRY